MNVQACSRCGYGVYPAEKISCLDQIWHKACFHCEVCKMMLSVNNFVSHQKKPYCHAHNPKINTFTSVYQTPLNVNRRKSPGDLHGRMNVSLPGSNPSRSRGSQRRRRSRRRRNDTETAFS